MTCIIITKLENDFGGQSNIHRLWACFMLSLDLVTLVNSRSVSCYLCRKDEDKLTHQGFPYRSCSPSAFNGAPYFVSWPIQYHGQSLSSLDDVSPSEELTEVVLTVA